jgi:hypothetical protein
MLRIKKSYAGHRMLKQHIPNRRKVKSLCSAGFYFVASRTTGRNWRVAHLGTQIGEMPIQDEI